MSGSVTSQVQRAANLYENYGQKTIRSGLPDDEGVLIFDPRIMDKKQKRNVCEKTPVLGVSIP
jgi:hypothetical protein